MSITELSDVLFSLGRGRNRIERERVRPKAGEKIWQIDKVQFSQIHGPSEQDQRAPGSFLPADSAHRLRDRRLRPAFTRPHTASFRPSSMLQTGGFRSGEREKAIEIATESLLPQGDSSWHVSMRPEYWGYSKAYEFPFDDKNASYLA
jgi:hypothetical protein